MTDKATEKIQWSIERLACAITPLDATPGTDATGGKVGSLTEAVMGMAAGLVQIAEAIGRLADATVDLNDTSRAIEDLSAQVANLDKTARAHLFGDEQ
jgi:ABC-type transporter Mla subunit MlaD